MTHSRTAPRSEPGPFHADQLHDGDRYELSNGHPLYCAPSGPEHAARSLGGGAMIDSDPDVEWAGVDAGFSPEPGMLRAPDVAVAGPPEARGWIRAAPPLALEYAAQGQDEAELQVKIAELIGHGTRWVWVVRLTGPRRVEVHESGRPMRLAHPGEDLEAPGILRNPVPVEALFDRQASHGVTLRNLLQRFGYEDLEAVRAEGRAEGLAAAVLSLLEGRGIDVDAQTRTRIGACRDTARLNGWLLAAANVDRAERMFDD